MSAGPSENECPAGWFRESYDADAECIDHDPCSPDGVTTLWTFQACEVPTTVAIGEPLPETGAGFGLEVTVAVILVAVGAVLSKAVGR